MNLKIIVYINIIMLLLVRNSAQGATLYVQGITSPYKDSTMSSSVDGIISIIHIKEGALVRKGQVILELKHRQEILEVKRRKLIFESKVELQVAEKRVDTFKENYQATLHLFETTQTVSKEELMNKKLEYNIAEAEYEGYVIAEKREQIEYAIAKVQLENRLVKAPFDGIVAKIHLKIGEFSNAQEPLLRIVNIDKIRFRAHVEAEATWELKPKMIVHLSVDKAKVPVKLKGIIDYVSPVIDASSELREVKAIFDNPDHKVSPGVSGFLSGE